MQSVCPIKSPCPPPSEPLDAPTHPFTSIQLPTQAPIRAPSCPLWSFIPGHPGPYMSHHVPPRSPTSCCAPPNHSMPLLAPPCPSSALSLSPYVSLMYILYIKIQFREQKKLYQKHKCCINKHGSHQKVILFLAAPKCTVAWAQSVT